MKILNKEFSKKIKDFVYKIIVSVIIIFVFVLIGKLVKKIIIKSLTEKSDHTDRKKIIYATFADMIYYLIIFVGVIFALINLGYQLSSILIVLGSIGLALALAIQSTITQVISGIIILFFGHFNIGDIITINDKTGFVTEFNLLNTTITDSYDQKIVIGNSSFINSAFINHTINKEIIFPIFISVSNTNDIDYNDLMETLKEAVRNDCKYVINKEKVNTVIYDIKDTGTVIRLTFPIESKFYLKAGHDARGIVRKVISDEGITLLDYDYGTSLGKSK